MDIVILVLSVVLCVGVKLAFHACETGENVMACHWAEQAVFAMGIVLVVQSAALLLCRESGMRKGICLAMIPTSAVTAFIPGFFIHLCMMKDMRCHTVMRPAVMIVAILITVCAIVRTVQQKVE